PAWSIALAADGKTALIGEGRGACEILDLAHFTLTPVKLSEMGVPLRLSDPNATAPASMPSTYSESITVVAIATAGGSALAGGADRMFSIFPLSGGGGGLTRRSGGPVSAACFTADGKRAIVAVQQTLWVIDAATGRVVQRIPTNLRLISAVAISPD